MVSESDSNTVKLQHSMEEQEEIYDFDRRDYFLHLHIV